MFKRLLYWSREDDSELGRPKLSGSLSQQNFSIPMWILGLVHVLEDMGLSQEEVLELNLTEVREWAVDRLKLHVQREGTKILELVTHEGMEIEGCEGRKMVPGRLWYDYLWSKSNQLLGNC